MKLIIFKFKHCEYKNEDEGNSPNILSDINVVYMVKQDYKNLV